MYFGDKFNLIVTAAFLFAVGALLYIRLSGRKTEQAVLPPAEGKYTIERMTEYVKQCLNEMVAANWYHTGFIGEELQRRNNKRLELKRALKGCVYGDLSDKNYVKNVIYDLLLQTYGLNEGNVNRVIPFEDARRLTEQDMFEIILHDYKKKYRYDALHRIIARYRLDEPKSSPAEGDAECYVITGEEVRTIYNREAPALTFDDKLQLIVQRIYQQYKGFSVIDEIRDMNIDGVSGGVSGLPPSFAGMPDEFRAHTRRNDPEQLPSAHDSVWIFYKGKSIHLSFLSFGSEWELKRVCQNIYKYNNPGQLSETNGYKVNEMKDGSRVVVVRPHFSESWAFFVRKFDIPNVSLEQLIRDRNSELAIGTIKYLMKGSRITAVTGAQGSGKTTLLMAMVKHIYATLTLRVQEMAFELHLRKIYPNRNILSLRETDHISGQAGLDVQKKTDGSVNIVGEAATDPVAAWVIQTSQVASLFTLFTHHAKTFRDLVHSLRNSLLKTGVFSNEQIAERQVTSVINFDIHLKLEKNGRRYIERITECVPVEHAGTYGGSIAQAATLNEKMERFMETAADYLERAADRRTYVERNIVEYRGGEYVAVHPISAANAAEMIEQMTEQDANAFKAFVASYWGDNHGT
ncbi:MULTISPECIES: Flp pilus assembly complex ATPase component TadA [unclassified Paenibacillus]|uniref:Flp pilus assembly complex ATPase component TadA n=1 Tax=unclassified Paenibacillus TaxID=185978 RepID=UPI001C10FF1C|nr:MULTISPECIES: Flp pilus assembly complex ATPase component TadA [unclassified Paenibacillus]MBU5443159.1 Flp pilus assembly complex ATPase component TadA [Paenibacillus sp. MSJ-34]CAH0121171.1 hypothetical protein PAE9249_03697 [Paenibacillus sp. CECT 9249]